MDNQLVDNVDVVNIVVIDLDGQDVVIIGVNIGNFINLNDFEIIIKDLWYIIIVGVNKLLFELVKEIIDVIFISVRSKSFFFFCFIVNVFLFIFIFYLLF